ncbi:hypothetical protein F5144DRAFT_498950 [Chaetomium tenue]|uniref:Uncharacterized protein n=1 Tax=Chaetomium tenue TaxID=1854479 RepID=A0ACB7NVS1_9PEZI|nr:hypothetical protein F5144DRAFT_498950 [Chaetomium globosum]
MAPFGSLFLLPFLFVSILALDRCFFPNRKVANFAASCWDTTRQQTVLCCQIGDLCLSNKICAATNDPSKEFRYYRGACLDSNWTDPGCPNMCRGPDGDDKIVPMHRCRGGKSDNEWYCGKDRPSDEDCKEIDGDVALPAGFVAYATAGITPDPIPTSSVEESPTTSEDPTNTIQPALGQPETTPDLSDPQPTTGGLGVDVLTAAPSDPPQDSGEASSAVPVAVGVAVGTSILIAGSVLVFFYQRKRRRQAPVRAETPPPFEFSFINSQAPGWLGPSYGPKPPVPQPDDKMHDKSKPTPNTGGTAQHELP